MAANSSVRDLKDEATDRLSDNKENFTSAFDQLRHDVVDLISHAFGVGKNTASEAMGSVKDHASDAMDTLKDQISHLREKGTDQVQAVGKKIEDNPITATAIAFGVGFILAKILSRK
jgi:ElaB/YqjD/DUF883 family membrane-anchored ribosome-binding protein